jgi:hypothetical protein
MSRLVLEGSQVCVKLAAPLGLGSVAPVEAGAATMVECGAHLPCVFFFVVTECVVAPG